MIVSIASGKGGTGKTTVAVNMALSIGDVQLLDCDVEEPNAHILLKPRIDKIEQVQVSYPRILDDKCNLCGDCANFCKYNALFVTAEKVIVFPGLCHSCGGCSLICPNTAIIEEKRVVGTTKKGTKRNIELVYGELNVGEPMAGPVIRAVKAHLKRDGPVIIDAPPGTACPLVASIHGSDFCILVTEPTPFGLHDLKITTQVVRQLEIPFGVVVNMAGIGDKEVYNYCEKEEIPIMLEIPFERRIAELYSRGLPFTEEMPEWKAKFLSLWDDTEERVNC